MYRLGHFSTSVNVMSRVKWQLTGVAAVTWTRWSGRAANGSRLTADSEAGWNMLDEFSNSTLLVS